MPLKTCEQLPGTVCCAHPEASSVGCRDKHMEAENAYLAHAKKADVAKGNLDGFVYASHLVLSLNAVPLHACTVAFWLS